MIKIRFLFLTTVVVCVCGTAGYQLIESWSFTDAAYMTVITMTTTGYGEVHTLSEAGKWFTIFLNIVSFGIMAYVASMLLNEILHIHLTTLFGRKKMNKRISRLKNHTILCGYGKMGRSIAESLRRAKHDFMVIEHDHSLRELLTEDDIPFLIGDASSDELLLEAGIERADSLVSVVSSDGDNLIVSLSARSLNHKIHIISRLFDEGAQYKFVKAGANKVLSPYSLTSNKIAQSIINPAIDDFLEIVIRDETVDFQMADLTIHSKSKCVNKELKSTNFRNLGIIVVQIKKIDGSRIFAPGPDEIIEEGDNLITLGSGTGFQTLLKENALS